MNYNRIIFCFIVLLIFPLSSCERKSGRKNTRSLTTTPHIEQQSSTSRISKGTSTVKMETEYGVKYIWIEINGLRLRFIFDTGASSICMSPAEATVLYRQGTLKRDDIIDIQYIQDATGRISAGTRINLRTVKIGDRVLKNIEAIVLDNNEAPLLLGQSALERFGKISIDNNKGEITFE